MIAKCRRCKKIEIECCVCGKSLTEKNYCFKRCLDDGTYEYYCDKCEDPRILKTEDIIKPDYYGKLDVLKFCLENNIPFCEGNIIKYVVRYTKKGGVQDLKKAQEYLNRLIDSFEDKK